MVNCQTESPDPSGAWGFSNTPISAQSGTFTAEWDAMPLAAGVDALMSLTNGPQTFWDNLAATVRFNMNNTVDAINNSTSIYSADNQIAYVPNTTYHFRMVADVPTHTYSVYVAGPGGSEQLLAANYLFRSTQRGRV